MKKRWTAEEIRQKLASGNPVWLARAAQAIYECHVADELNGFDPGDAARGTHPVRLLGRGFRLTDLPAYHDWACREMPRYAEQLARLANRGG
jgi:hypothetical protein